MLGKIITMFSSIIGIAIVALPAGIITAGYMNEITKKGKKFIFPLTLTLRYPLFWV